MGRRTIQLIAGYCWSIHKVDLTKFLNKPIPIFNSDISHPFLLVRDGFKFFLNIIKPALKNKQSKWESGIGNYLLKKYRCEHSPITQTLNKHHTFTDDVIYNTRIY
jgi:hypothetical protein